MMMNVGMVNITIIIEWTLLIQLVISMDLVTIIDELIS